MSQAQAAELAEKELSDRFFVLVNYCKRNLPEGSAKDAAIEKLFKAKAKAVEALTE